jgi:hypothetical protein
MMKNIYISKSVSGACKTLNVAIQKSQENGKI